MLWLMRRPWMKRLQRASSNLFPASKREKAKRSMNMDMDRQMLG